MLKTRIMVAAFLLAVFLPVACWAPIRWFGLLVASILAVAAWEWAILLKLGKFMATFYALVLGMILSISALNLTLAAALQSYFSISLYQVAFIFWVFVAPFALMRRPKLCEGPWRAFLLILGVFLFLACWHALIVARCMSVTLMLSLLLVVWLADSGAYFVGCYWGRRKLAPSVSPGKTWEGVLGGWLLVIIVSSVAIAKQIFAPTLFSMYAKHVGWWGALSALTILVAMSVVGDLFESLMKRQAGVKDSSALLPGHGGVLDRIDALMPVLPLAVLFFS